MENELTKIGIVPELTETQLGELDQLLRVVGVFMTKRVLATVTDVIRLFLQKGTDITVTELRALVKENEQLYTEQK